ncbi:unnamed protein product [Lasius platythorax]|uniref:Uncharacterized protein n=1 Tax=Lasius platythorax TaxID=488582 RepID=A0AAV2NR25_9HYME
MSTKNLQLSSSVPSIPAYNLEVSNANDKHARREFRRSFCGTISRNVRHVTANRAPADTAVEYKRIEASIARCTRSYRL